jgi:citrate lyase subunit beta/citryl-CoA lyase
VRAWAAGPESDSGARAAARAERLGGLVRRSVLIVPANVYRFVEKAHRRGSDAVMLDLEDSVPPGQKAGARRALGEAIASVGRGGADVLVRINKPFDMAIEDLDAAVVPGLAAIGFPKAESEREVAILDALIRERELRRGLTPGGIGLAVTVETARGLARVDAILSASDRIETVDVGTEDLTRDLEIEPSAGGEELLLARQTVVQAARRAGVQPLGLSTTLANYGDLDALRDSVARAHATGFRGAGCIHPDQVPVLNELFQPSGPSVERARRVLTLYEEALAAGRASAALDGQMIDVPVAERASRLIARTDAIARKEAHKREALERLVDG